MSLLVVPPTRAAEAPPLFELETAAGTTLTGPLQELATDWSVLLKGKRVPGAEAVSLQQASRKLPAPPTSAQVLLADGGILPGTVATIANDRVILHPDFPLQTAEDKPWSLPLARVAVVWLAPPQDVVRPRSLLRRLARESRARDVILFRNGDRMEGTVQGMTGQEVQIEGEGKKKIAIPRAQVAALAFNTALLSRSLPKGVYCLLRLANGGRLVLTSARVPEGGTTLRGRLPTGNVLKVPLSQVMALTFHQGCAVYLSDLKGPRYEFTPYLGARWPFVADGSAADEDIQLAGSTYVKGLGMHSKSRLTFLLPAGARSFAALVGMDERSGRRGRARIQVLLDGKPLDLGWTGDLAGRAAPRRIHMNIRQGRELTLVVDFGPFGDIQGYVNWADARVIVK